MDAQRTDTAPSMVRPDDRDGLRTLNLAKAFKGRSEKIELELAAARDPRLRRRMTDAALVFWRLCEPIVLALGSDDPELDGRQVFNDFYIVTFVDGQLALYEEEPVCGAPGDC